MSVRSNDHQLVAAKQYFDDEVQIENNIYNTRNVYGVPIDATLAVGSGFLMDGQAAGMVQGWQTKTDGIRKTTIRINTGIATSSDGREGLFSGNLEGEVIGAKTSASCYLLDLQAAVGVDSTGIIPSGELPIKFELRAAEVNSGGDAGDLQMSQSAVSTIAQDATFVEDTGFLDTTAAITLFETISHTAWDNTKRYVYLSGGTTTATKMIGGVYYLNIESQSTGSDPTTGIQ
jgi:hypothetical protein